MTVPGEVKLALHVADIDDDGHHAPGSGGAADDITIVDAGGYYTGTDVEAALQELGASVDAIASYIPVMAQSPNIVTTDGTVIWLPLVLADGTPVVMAV